MTRPTKQDRIDELEDQVRKLESQNQAMSVATDQGTEVININEMAAAEIGVKVTGSIANAVIGSMDRGVTMISKQIEFGSLMAEASAKQGMIRQIFSALAVAHNRLQRAQTPLDKFSAKAQVKLTRDQLRSEMMLVEDDEVKVDAVMSQIDTEFGIED